MIPVSIGEVITALDPESWGHFHDGSLLQSSEASEKMVHGSVQHDSRKIEQGDIFVALVGAKYDGHDFVQGAIDSGAEVLILSQSVMDQSRFEGLRAKEPNSDEASVNSSPVIVLVDDTLLGLGKLARLVLDKSPRTTVLAVTGSSGKTSTKDLLAQVLSRFGPTISPPGSFNNEIGLPMTALSISESTEFLILEMGARGVGHISTLTKIAPPKVGIVLNVGSAHAGEFGSIEVTKQAKQELIQALPKDGVAILNADDPLVRDMADESEASTISFGTGSDANVQVHNLVLDQQARPSFDVNVSDESSRIADTYQVSLNVHGAHNALNAAAVIAAAVAVGMEVGDACAALNLAVSVSPGRMNVIETPSGITIIDDTYNANLESMTSGLRSLAHAGRERTTWAVLGEMGELGDFSISSHDEAGRTVVRLGIDHLVVVGQGARPLYLAAAAEGFYNGEAVFADNIAEAEAILTDQLSAGDLVFLKASRFVGLDALVSNLVETFGSTRSNSAGIQ